MRIQNLLKSSLYEYSDPYIVVKGAIAITSAALQITDEIDMQLTFKNWASFTNCISQINSTYVDNAEYLDIVILLYNLIGYNNNYAKTGSLWQYQIAYDTAIIWVIQIQNQNNKKIPADDNTKNVEIVISLKYLIKFWKTLEMSLIYCEVNLQLAWSANCVIINSTGL